MPPASPNKCCSAPDGINVSQRCECLEPIKINRWAPGKQLEAVSHLPEELYCNSHHNNSALKVCETLVMPVVNIKLERPPLPQGKCLEEIKNDPNRCLSCFNLYAGTAWSRTSGPIYGLDVDTEYEVHRYAAERLGISPEIPPWATGPSRLDYAAWEARTPLRDILETSQAGCSSCTLIKQAVTSLCPDLASFEDPDLVAYLSFCTGRILWIRIYREELAQGSDEEDDEAYGFGQPFEQVSSSELLVKLEVYVLQGQKSLWPAIGCSMPHEEIKGQGVFADKIGGIAKHIVQNPESRPGLRRIRAWIDNCLANHKSCQEAASKNGPFLPKRVIHVGCDNNTTICLVEPAEDVEASYIALSHRWGKSTPPKLTKDTLGGRKHNIPWSQLTKTFQEAILVTRRLGIEYIWIDSLCIVQDDAADWAAEAAKMAPIYESALLVISATASTDGDEGCLLERTPYTEIRITAADSNELFTVFARKTLPHAGFLAEIPGGIEPESTQHPVVLYQCPLFSRAWCFQERLLGTRILHFLREEMVFECLSSIDCECGMMDGFTENSIRQLRAGVRLGHVPSDGELHPDEDLAWQTELVREMLLRHRLGDETEAGKRNLAFKVWHNLVSSYSEKFITFPSDTLPAVAGLASRWCRLVNSKYLCGLWADNLPPSLLWEVKKRGQRSIERQKEFESANYIAPTWSWAAAQKEVT